MLQSMPARETGARTVTIDELHVADEPDAWARLGFTVTDSMCRIGVVDVRLAGHSAGKGLFAWSLRGISSVELDGLPAGVSHAPPREPAGAHPNGVLAIDHVVVFSPALDRSVHALQQAGLELRRIREEPTPAGAPRQAFFRLGAEILEVIQEPESAVQQGGGGNRPARLWGLALLSTDLDRTVEALAPHASPARDAVQPGRRIATVRRSSGLSVPLALMSARAGRS
jgi:hypothetical protein